MAIPATSHVLAINAGSSSIKFALFELNENLTPVFDGDISAIGSAHSCFAVRGTGMGEVRVIRTDEQWMLAEEARLLLAGSSASNLESASHG
jgi:acetate kinase